MTPLIYEELLPWYRLLDPPTDHEDEASRYRDVLLTAVPEGRNLLELGSGAGNNASFLKQRFQCTLTDISEGMLALSRELNPECEHLLGDMRSLRLERRFDVVFVQDAVCYMHSEAELKSAMETAFVHLKPGGAVLFAPDADRDSFVEHTALYESDEGTRSLRCMEWTWDPDPSDTLYCVDYALLLRDGAELRAVHDRHIEGLFARETWLGLLGSVGFRGQVVTRQLDDGGPDYMFLGVRP
jgi:SAM-dependent methyltransferase